MTDEILFKFLNAILYNTRNGNETYGLFRQEYFFRILEIWGSIFMISKTSLIEFQWNQLEPELKTKNKVMLSLTEDIRLH